jgi:hypothetical protein
MPLQNRVDPYGAIVATVERGAWMGNRGCLHDTERRLGQARWARRQWVICELEFGDRHRTVMTPGSYTELFFLDEATALAAGHRPCGTCRREAYACFLAAWREVTGTAADLKSLDDRLHSQRAAVIGAAALGRAVLCDVPDGCFVAQGPGASPLLKWRGALLNWSFSGYSRAQDVATDQPVVLITPRVVRDILATGHVPQVDVSADRACRAEPPARRAATPIVSASSGRSASTDQQPLVDPLPASHRPPITADRGSATAETPPAPRLYRLSRTPAGRELYAYFAAILQTTGMDRGAAFPLKKFLGNFKGHVDAGRIEVAGSGSFRLTPSGRRYFTDRFVPGSPQYVAQVDVDRYQKGILQGGKGWVPIT